jgi:hypothetical protein
MERGRSDVGFTLLAGLLFTLVALAVMLSVKLIRAPAGTALPMLSLPADATCPEQSDATDCYEATVTNAGSGAGQIVCNVFPATGSTAVFGNLTSVYATPADSPVPPEGTFTLTVLATAEDGTKTQGTPTVACDAAA